MGHDFLLGVDVFLLACVQDVFLLQTLQSVRLLVLNILDLKVVGVVCSSSLRL